MAWMMRIVCRKVLNFIRKSRISSSRLIDRHPLFAVAVIAVGCVAAADIGGVAGSLAAVGFGLAGGFLRSWRRGLAWLICGLIAVGMFCDRETGRERAERALVGNGGVVTGRMLMDARGVPGLWSAPARLESGEWMGSQVWWEGSGALPIAGSWVKARGNFSPLKEPRNPEEFDEAAWRRRKGMVAGFRGQTLHQEAGRWALLGSKIRGGFRLAVTAGLEPESRQAQVIRAIVIGESPPDADELIAAFRNSGTLHIFSVSGMHVAMVGSIGWLVLRKAGLSRRRAVIAILPLIFGYSWISGNSAPAVRSAWMMAVFLMAFVFRRRPDLLNALGAVLLVAMLWDGNLLFQPGVQLSYGVVAAIAIGTGAARRMFEWIGRKEDYLPDDLIVGWRARWLRFRKGVALSLGVSSAAWIGSTPLTILHFGVVTPIAIIATGILAPIVYLVLAAALFSAVIHPVLPKVAERVNRLNGRLADGCVWTASALASVPGSHFETRSPGRPMLLVYDLDYGAGAAVFSGGADGAVLIDCGDRHAFKRRIVRSLRGLGISPDAIVLTHPDGGHIGGGRDVWQAFPVRQVLLPVDRSRSAGYKVWSEEAAKSGLEVIRAADVDVLPFPDGARLEILHVPDPTAYNALADERVAVFRLHWRGWKILLTSDAGSRIEARLLNSGKDLSADVIVAGKHRKDAALGDDFLNAVMPRAIVASHAEFPKEERLDPKQAEYWRSRGIHVTSQGEAGGVTIRVEDGGDLWIEGFVDHSRFRLKRR